MGNVLNIESYLETVNNSSKKGKTGPAVSEKTGPAIQKKRFSQQNTDPKDSVKLSEQAQNSPGPSSSSKATLEIGSIFNGYKILEMLGEGGFGTVYLAKKKGTGEKVVIKVALEGERPHKLLKNEIETLPKVRGRNVPRFIASGDSYMVMEYVEGMTLAEYLKINYKMPARSSMEVAFQVALVLERAHRQGRLHGDLKSANIMWPEVNVIDWGSPIKIGDNKIGEVFGTPGYMASEVYHGKGAGPRTDIFGLGAILFDMIEGKPPVSHILGEPQFSDLLEIDYSRFHPRLRRIFLRTLALRPENRYSSIQQLVYDMGRYLIEEGASFSRFKTAVTNGGGVGTMVYFSGRGIDSGFASDLKNVFPESEGFVVYRCEREGMEGVFVVNEKADERTMQERLQTIQERLQSKHKNNSGITSVIKTIDRAATPDKVFGTNVSEAVDAGNIARGNRGQMVRARSGGGYDIYLTSEGKFVDANYVRDTYRPILLKEAARIQRIDSGLGQEIYEKVSSMKIDEVAGIRHEDLRTLMSDLKAKIGEAVEKRIRGILQRVGLREKTIARKIAELRGMTGEARWRRIEGIWGKKASKIFKKRISLDQLGNLTSKGFKQFLKDLGKTSSGDKTALERFGFKSSEIKAIYRKMQIVKKKYNKAQKQRLAKVREALSKGKAINIKEALRWLNAIKCLPKLRDALGLTYQEVESLLSELKQKQPAEREAPIREIKGNTENNTVDLKKPSPGKVKDGQGKPVKKKVTRGEKKLREAQNRRQIMDFLVKLGRKCGLSGKEVRELMDKVKTPEKFFKEIAKGVNFDNLSKEVARIAETNPEKAMELKKWLIKVHSTKELKARGIGLLTGLASILGIEKVADLLGIHNPTARFVFVLGIAHAINVAVREGLIKGASLPKYLKEGYAAIKANKSLVPKGILKFSFGFVQAMGGMYLTGQAWGVLLKSLGVDPNSWAYSPTAMLAVAMGVPGVFGAAHSFATARTGSSAILRAVGVGGKALGWVGVGLWISDMYLNFMHKNYNISVAQRAADRKGSVLESALDALIPGPAVLSSTDDVKAVLEIDRQNSLAMRKDLATMIAENPGMAKEMLGEPVEFGKILTGKTTADGMPWIGAKFKIAVREIEIYEFAVKYMQKHKISDFNDSQVIEAVCENEKFKRLGFKKEHYDQVLPKMIRKSVQDQFSTLYFMDPDAYYHNERKTAAKLTAPPTSRGSGWAIYPAHVTRDLTRPRPANCLNDDIRTMFDDGALKPGMEDKFAVWARQNRSKEAPPKVPSTEENLSESDLIAILK